MKTRILSALLVLFSTIAAGQSETTQSDQQKSDIMVHNKKEISAAFPFESKYVEVNGSQMHYIEEGEGDPILFIHGIPTSSYLWRNVIPHISDNGRCIAVDLIGMGKSDQPEIDYDFFSIYDYLEGFIEKLELKNVTLVIHDWGSGLGFHYAHLHKENVKGIAFMEAMVSIPDVKEMPFGTKMGLRMMRSKVFGPFMVSRANLMFKKIIPDLTMRKLTDEEMAYYESPYPTAKSKKILLWGPRAIPFKGSPAAVEKEVRSYIQWLTETEIPMLGFEVKDGVGLPPHQAQWAKDHIKQVEFVDLGEGIHFVQEDYPHEIGEAIAEWYGRL